MAESEGAVAESESESESEIERVLREIISEE